MSAPSPSPSPSPIPTPAPIPTPVRKLSISTASAISAGASAFHALASQVGGHPGMLASEDNALIVKASLPRERAFYELLAQESAGVGVGVARLQPFVPRFYGTLRLEGRVTSEKGLGLGLEPTGGGAALSTALGLEQDAIVPVAELEEKDEYSIVFTATLQSIVLENISSVFTTPNILDIKLGTVLYEEDSASPEKKERMLETARNTTSLETGVRLTGFQVHDYTVGAHVVTPKAYGKSIKASDLPDGMRRFFPVSPSPSPADSNADAAPPGQGQGLPRELLLPILHGLLHDIRTLRAALAQTELRMVGGSLLIVYEADWAAARAALSAQAAANAVLASAAAAAASETGLANSSGQTVGGEDDEAEEGYDSDVESEDGETPAYAVKLIDFAHTKLVPGQGPDEGVLKGVDTTISLFEGRIKELEAGAE